LLLPASTPDLLIVALPAEYRDDERFVAELPNLGRASQGLLSSLYAKMEQRIKPGEFVLAIALKKSLRSDRLYQPPYEANIMQLLLEGRLAAPQVDFEVHTLRSAGTRADETYRSASLLPLYWPCRAASSSARPYEPENADQLVRRFLSFLAVRMEQVPPVAT
jgi:hypothetical protein